MNKKETCADVAKDFVTGCARMNTDVMKTWQDRFKHCFDYPAEPEVVEFKLDLSDGGDWQVPNHMVDREWQITAVAKLK